MLTIALLGVTLAFMQCPAWQHRDRLRCHITQGQLVFTPAGDGPFVIHGVVAYGQSTGDKRIAALPEPLIIADSEGGSVEYASLKWRNYAGIDAPPPTDQKLVAIYSNGLQSDP